MAARPWLQSSAVPIAVVAMIVFAVAIELRLQAIEADVELIHALQFNVRPDFQRINRMLSRHERRITRIEDRMEGPM